MNHYPFYVGDYMRDTMHLTNEQDLMYRRAIDYCYMTGRPLPLDKTQWVSIGKASGPVWVAAMETVIESFFRVREDGYYNDRIERELEKMNRKVQAARDNGKLGGRKRNPVDNPVGTQPVSGLVVSAVEVVEPAAPPTLPLKPPLKKKASIDGDEALFDEFWQGYPKKSAKPVARRAWDKLGVDALLSAQIVQAVENFKRTEQWMKDGGQFIPMPATWLNQRRWEDEIEISGEVGTGARDIFSGGR